MEGKLIKTSYGWCVNSLYGILPIHPDLVKCYLLTDEDEGQQVECEVVTRLSWDALKMHSIEVPTYVTLKRKL
jgi:hypothetical protein